MTNPLTPDRLTITLETLDALHTKAMKDCLVRTAQALTVAMSVVRTEIARANDQAQRRGEEKP